MAPPRDPEIPDPLAMTRDAFVRVGAGAGIGPGRAAEIYRAVHREGRADARGVAIPPIVRRLEEDTDEGTTVKFVQRLAAPGGRVGDLETESVIIPMVGRTGARTHTLCVSSQVGCAMGCGFCETAQMGLIRSLTAREIVAQWWAATHAEGVKIDNIVFMGMGEPLDNLDAVLDAIAVLTDHHGPAVPMRAITISTVGRVDGLRRLVEVVQKPGWKRLGLALSLNAPNDAVRDEIMPLNRKWGLDELQRVMIELMRVRGSRKILFEYVLIPGGQRRARARPSGRAVARALHAHRVARAHRAPQCHPVQPPAQLPVGRARRSGMFRRSWTGSRGSASSSNAGARRDASPWPRAASSATSGSATGTSST